VHHHLVDDDIFFFVVISEPQEPQYISMLWVDMEVVEHLLYITHHTNGISSESDQYSLKTIVHIWT
jgi:hypothetical protein